MISGIDIRDMEMSPETVKLYEVKRGSVVSPVEDKTFVVLFDHIDGMYSLGYRLLDNSLVHLAAWCEVNTWRKKID